MNSDPVFEFVECAGKTEVNCWVELNDGHVYRNRELTPFQQLPFVVVEHPIPRSLQS